MGKALSGDITLPPIARFFAEQRLFVSEGSALTFVSLFLMPKADVERTVARLREMAATVKGAKLTVTGPAMVDVALHRALQRDGIKLTVLALLGALLALVIARMPLQRVLIAASALLLIFTGLYGLLSWLDFPLTLVTLLVFPFVLGVGIDATVYLLDHPDFQVNGRKLLRHHLRPLLASTLTTLSGFLALTIVPLTDIRRLGVSVAIGLALALIVALTWVIGFARRPS